MKEQEPTFFRQFVSVLRESGFVDPPQRTTIHLPPLTGAVIKDSNTGEPRHVPHGVSLVKEGIQVDVFRNPDGGCEVRAQHARTGAFYRAVYGGTEPTESLDEKVEQLEAALFGRKGQF